MDGHVDCYDSIRYIEEVNNVLMCCLAALAGLMTFWEVSKWLRARTIERRIKNSQKTNTEIRDEALAAALKVNNSIKDGYKWLEETNGQLDITVAALESASCMLLQQAKAIQDAEEDTEMSGSEFAGIEATLDVANKEIAELQNKCTREARPDITIRGHSTNEN